MGNLWRVAAHEYRIHIRRAGFLFAAFGVPLLSVGLMVIASSLVASSFTEPSELERVAVIDEAGVIGDDQWGIFTRYANLTAARTALKAGEVDGILRLPLDYRERGGAELTTDVPVDWVIQEEISAYLRSQLLVGISGLSKAEGERAVDTGNITLFTLDNELEQDLANPTSFFLLPIAFGLIWMMTAQTTSSYLMMSVVEEKSNRIMELLITSMTPGQLLRGKLLGLAALGLTQLLIWSLVSALLLTAGGRSIPFLAGLQVPLDMLLIASAYFLMIFALMAIVSATIGAVVGTVHESRQYAGILTLLIWIPMMLFSLFIGSPNALLPQILTFFPLTAPMTVTLRLGLSNIPTLQLAISATILLLTTIAALWVGERLFRWSLLRYGKRSSLRGLFRTLREQWVGQKA